MRRSAARPITSRPHFPSWATAQYGNPMKPEVRPSTTSSRSGEVICSRQSDRGWSSNDSHKDSPGADDNASAVAALLELARAAIGWEPRPDLAFEASRTRDQETNRSVR